MKIKIIETKPFEREIKSYLKKGSLINQDYLEFKEILAKYPEIGDLINGTNGLRKVRLKSTSKGKSGGFRVCYYFYNSISSIFLLTIFSKNELENITSSDKKIYKETIKMIKENNA